MVDGVNTLEADVGALAQKAGYVYQDFENQIVRPTVLDDASYACLNYAMPDYVERGKEALALCGLEGREGDYIWQLSGGQTHLLALAGAVSLRPEVLILDEPIAQLDPGHADRIYQVLKELNEKHGKTIIVIEHHTEYIADYCKHVMLMRGRKHRLEAAHQPGFAPGGRAAGVQHLPAPGDPGGLRPAEGRYSPGECPSAHHGGGRREGFCRPAIHPPGKSRRPPLPAVKAPCPFRTCPSPTAR